MKDCYENCKSLNLERMRTDQEYWKGWGIGENTQEYYINEQTRI